MKNPPRSIFNHLVRNAKRLTAGSLSVVFLFTQVAFAHKRETSLWDARRQASRAPAPVLARLPESVAPPLNAFDAGHGVRSLPNLAGLPASAADTIAAATAAIGASATVGEILLPKKTGGMPVVLFLQDIHGRHEAQLNISAALTRLHAWRSDAVIGVEGAEGAVDAAPFRGPRAAGNLFEASFFLNAGVIAGPEHAALTSETPLTLFGVEDKSLYLANVAAVRAAWPKRAEMTAAMASRRAKIDSEADRAFTPDMRAFARLTDGYASHHQSLPEFISAMSRHPSYPAADLPELARFLKALSLETSLNTAAADEERGRLVSRLCAVLGKRDLDALVSAGAAARAGTLSNPAFCGILERATKTAGVSLDEYPAFRAYLSYVTLANGLRADRILAETLQAENRIWASLCRTDAQRRLVAERRQARLAEKLVSLSLTTPEWAAYKPERSPNPALAPFEAFYTAAESRNQALADRLLSQIPARGNRTAVLVAGGFHKDGLCRRLLEKGAAIVVLTPRLKNAAEGDAADYLSVFTRGRTPLSEIFDSPAITLANTLALSPIDRTVRRNDELVWLAPELRALDAVRAGRQRYGDAAADVARRAGLLAGDPAAFAAAGRARFQFTKSVVTADFEAPRPHTIRADGDRVTVTGRNARTTRATRMAWAGYPDWFVEIFIAPLSEATETFAPLEFARSHLSGTRRDAGWRLAGSLFIAYNIINVSFYAGFLAAIQLGLPMPLLWAAIFAAVSFLSGRVLLKDREARQKGLAGLSRFERLAWFVIASPGYLGSEIGHFLFNVASNVARVFGDRRIPPMVADVPSLDLAGLQALLKDIRLNSGRERVGRVLPGLKNADKMQEVETAVADLLRNERLVLDDDAIDFLLEATTKTNREARETVAATAVWLADTFGIYVGGVERTAAATTAAEPVAPAAPLPTEPKARTAALRARMAALEKEIDADLSSAHADQAANFKTLRQSYPLAELAGEIAIIQRIHPDAARQFHRVIGYLISSKARIQAPLIARDKADKIQKLIRNSRADEAAQIIAQHPTAKGLRAMVASLQSNPALRQKIQDYQGLRDGLQLKAMSSAFDGRLPFQTSTDAPYLMIAPGNYGLAAAPLVAPVPGLKMVLAETGGWAPYARRAAETFAIEDRVEVVAAEPAELTARFGADGLPVVLLASPEESVALFQPDFSALEKLVVPGGRLLVSAEPGPRTPGDADKLVAALMHDDQREAVRALKDRLQADGWTVRAGHMTDKNVFSERESGFTAKAYSCDTLFVFERPAAATPVAPTDLREPFALRPDERAALVGTGQGVADFLGDRSLTLPGQNRQPVSDPMIANPDLLIVFGVGNELLGERAADFFVEARKRQPTARIVFTGGIGRATPPLWVAQGRPEAQALSEAFLRRIRQIAPAMEAEARAAMIIEGASTNSGQNVAFTMKRLGELGIHPTSVLLLHNPLFQLRSSLATWLKQSGLDVPTTSFAPYHIDLARLDDAQLYAAVRFMLGEIDRLRQYPAQGFTVPIALSDVQGAEGALLPLLRTIEARDAGRPLPDSNALIGQTPEFGRAEAKDVWDAQTPTGTVDEPRREAALLAQRYAAMEPNGVAVAGQPFVKNPAQMAKMSAMFRDRPGQNPTAIDTDIVSTAIGGFSPDFSAVLRNIVTEWTDIVGTQNHYIVDPETYHVALSVAQEIPRRSAEGAGILKDRATRLTARNVRDIFQEVRGAVRSLAAFNLVPKGVRIGDDGGLIFVFEYAPEAFAFRTNVIRAAEAMIPGYVGGRPKPLVHITLLRIRSQVTPDEDQARRINAFFAKYREVGDAMPPLPVTQFRFGHKTRWMNEAFDLELPLALGKSNDGQAAALDGYLARADWDHPEDGAGRMSVARGSEAYEKYIAPLWESALLSLVAFALPLALAALFELGGIQDSGLALTVGAFVTLILTGTGGATLADRFKQMHRDRGRDVGEAPLTTHFHAFAAEGIAVMGLLFANAVGLLPVSLAGLVLGALVVYAAAHVAGHLRHNISESARRRMALNGMQTLDMERARFLARVPGGVGETDTVDFWIDLLDTACRLGLPQALLPVIEPLVERFSGHRGFSGRASHLLLEAAELAVMRGNTDRARAFIERAREVMKRDDPFEGVIQRRYAQIMGLVRTNGNGREKTVLDVINADSGRRLRLGEDGLRHIVTRHVDAHGAGNGSVSLFPAGLNGKALLPLLEIAMRTGVSGQASNPLWGDHELLCILNDADADRYGVRRLLVIFDANGFVTTIYPTAGPRGRFYHNGRRSSDRLMNMKPDGGFYWNRETSIPIALRWGDADWGLQSLIQAPNGLVGRLSGAEREMFLWEALAGGTAAGESDDDIFLSYTVAGTRWEGRVGAEVVYLQISKLHFDFRRLLAALPADLRPARLMNTGIHREGALTRSSLARLCVYGNPGSPEAVLADALRSARARRELENAIVALLVDGRLHASDHAIDDLADMLSEPKTGDLETLAGVGLMLRNDYGVFLPPITSVDEVMNGLTGGIDRTVFGQIVAGADRLPLVTKQGLSPSQAAKSVLRLQRNLGNLAGEETDASLRSALDRLGRIQVPGPALAPTGAMSVIDGSETYEKYVAPLWESPAMTLAAFALPWIFIGVAAFAGINLSLPDTAAVGAIVTFLFVFLYGSVLSDWFKSMHGNDRAPGIGDAALIAHGFGLGGAVLGAGAFLLANALGVAAFSLLALALFLTVGYGVAHTVFHLYHNITSPTENRMSVFGTPGSDVTAAVNAELDMRAARGADALREIFNSDRELTPADRRLVDSYLQSVIAPVETRLVRDGFDFAQTARLVRGGESAQDAVDRVRVRKVLAQISVAENTRASGARPYAERAQLARLLGREGADWKTARALLAAFNRHHGLSAGTISSYVRWRLGARSARIDDRRAALGVSLDDGTADAARNADPATIGAFDVGVFAEAGDRSISEEHLLRRVRDVRSRGHGDALIYLAPAATVETQADTERRIVEALTELGNRRGVGPQMSAYLAASRFVPFDASAFDPKTVFTRSVEALFNTRDGAVVAEAVRTYRLSLFTETAGHVLMDDPVAGIEVFLLEAGLRAIPVFRSLQTELDNARIAATNA